MAKVMIEVEIPAGRSIAEAKQAVAMKFDPDWMTEHWHIDDVIEQAENNGEQLTIGQAREVLRLIEKNHDCEVGINWDVIDNWVEHVVGVTKAETIEAQEER
jgi:hypothetical protein